MPYYFGVIAGDIAGFLGLTGENSAT